MASRKTIFAPGEYYHLVGRGIAKQKLFLDNRDFTRFLFILLYFQSPHIVYNVSHNVSSFIRNGHFSVAQSTYKSVISNKIAALNAFTLMSNHFHLLVQETEEGGISSYMHRVLTSYAKYFNEKYDKSGHVFQGPFKAVHVGSHAQMLYLGSYIHRNQREIAKWKDKEVEYPWSSYWDYGKANRWGELLDQDIIFGESSSPEEYINFVETSGAKESSD